jgi:hypothetical protein
MSVGVTKDYKLKVRNLHASHALGWSLSCVQKKQKKEKKKSFVNEVEGSSSSRVVGVCQRLLAHDDV